MKLKITTVYENVDSEWLSWWFSSRPPLPEIADMPRALTEERVFVTEGIDPDPLSVVTARTVYELVDEHQ